MAPRRRYDSPVRWPTQTHNQGRSAGCRVSRERRCLECALESIADERRPAYGRWSPRPAAGAPARPRCTRWVSTATIYVPRLVNGEHILRIVKVSDDKLRNDTIRYTIAK